jgi:hypothetical protein
MRLELTMAKLVKRLTDLKIKQGIEPASYPDGNGLYLQVRKSGAKVADV